MGCADCTGGEGKNSYRNQNIMLSLWFLYERLASNRVNWWMKIFKYIVPQSQIQLASTVIAPAWGWMAEVLQAVAMKTTAWKVNIWGLECNWKKISLFKWNALWNHTLQKKGWSLDIVHCVINILVPAGLPACKCNLNHRNLIILGKHLYFVKQNYCYKSLESHMYIVLTRFQECW
jgi:hypothetical protein